MQRLDRAAEPQPQSCCQADFVSDDSLDCGRLLNDQMHLIEGFHVERDQDAVRRSQAHIMPFSDGSARNSSVSQPACLVRHRIVHGFIHGEPQTVLCRHQPLTARLISTNSCFFFDPHVAVKRRSAHYSLIIACRCHVPSRSADPSGKKPTSCGLVSLSGTQNGWRTGANWVMLVPDDLTTQLAFLAHSLGCSGPAHGLKPRSWFFFAVTDDVLRCCFPTVGLHQLTCDPFSRWRCPDGTITVARAGNDLALFWFGSIEANMIVAYGTLSKRQSFLNASSLPAPGGSRHMSTGRSAGAARSSGRRRASAGIARGSGRTGAGGCVIVLAGRGSQASCASSLAR